MVTTCLYDEEKPESVKKVSGSRSTRPASHVTWPLGCHLATNRLLQVGGAPPGPYKYRPPVEIRTHIPLPRNSTCKVLILSVVARHSLVERVVRFWGSEGLPAWWEPSSKLKRRSSIGILWGPIGFLGSSLLECRSSRGILWILTETLLVYLGWSSSPDLSKSLCFHASDLGYLPIIVSYPITSLLFFMHLHIIW
jgi:hypothetical protein